MPYRIKYLEYLHEEICKNGCTPERAHKYALDRVKGFIENEEKVVKPERCLRCDGFDDDITGTKSIVNVLGEKER